MYNTNMQYLYRICRFQLENKKIQPEFINFSQNTFFVEAGCLLMFNLCFDDFRVCFVIFVCVLFVRF